MTIIKPPRLQPGQTIGLLAPASGVADGTKIDRAIAFFEGRGYGVKLGTHARSTTSYLAASDADRAADLHALWEDDDVDALWCLRGGYGTYRLLDRLDFALFRRRPKLFVGFSDITTLHYAMGRRSGLVTIHGPMAAVELWKEDCPPFTWEKTLRLLSDPAPLGSFTAGSPDLPPIALVGGAPVRGRLTGGNVAHVEATLGTQDEVDTAGKIVFLEDLSERAYRLDRMLTHLMAAGKLSDAAGIALGTFADCGEPGDDEATTRVKLAALFTERLGGLGIPVVMGLPFGHTPVNAALAYGIEATLDASAPDLVLEEGAVV